MTRGSRYGRRMTYQTVRYESQDGIATITLDRPDHLNAWTARLGAELGDAMAAADEDDDVRAVVVTGAGRAFCAGADLSGGGFGGGEAPKLRERWPYQVRKPVIAAINGHAVGVGITYPMMCDIRYVAEDAKLAFAFVRRGAIPELASHAIVPRVAGFAVAAELLLSGRTFLGSEAASLGIATRALPAAEVLPAALALAKDIAANTAPVSVAVAKRLLWEAMDKSIADVSALENRAFPKGDGAARCPRGNRRVRREALAGLDRPRQHRPPELRAEFSSIWVRCVSKSRLSAPRRRWETVRAQMPRHRRSSSLPLGWALLDSAPSCGAPPSIDGRRRCEPGTVPEATA